MSPAYAHVMGFSQSELGILPEYLKLTLWCTNWNRIKMSVISEGEMGKFALLAVSIKNINICKKNSTSEDNPVKMYIFQFLC